MPRRTHYTRLQRVERLSGTCVCQQPLVLTCTKAIDEHDRDELAAEPCPAGCAPEKRLVVAMRLSPWRNGEECRCPTCDPKKGKRPAVHEPVAEPAPALLAPEPAGTPTASADVSEPHPDAGTSPAPGYGGGAGLEEPLPAVLVRDQVLDVRVAYPFGGVGIAALCAVCAHGVTQHLAPRLGALCLRCGWPFQNHDVTACGLSMLYPHRFSPCLSYRAEPDGCDECGCAGYRLPYERVSRAERAFRNPEPHLSAATVATPVVRHGSEGLRTKSGGPIYVPGAFDRWMK